MGDQNPQDNPIVAPEAGEDCSPIEASTRSTFSSATDGDPATGDESEPDKCPDDGSMHTAMNDQNAARDVINISGREFTDLTVGGTQIEQVVLEAAGSIVGEATTINIENLILQSSSPSDPVTGSLLGGTAALAAIGCQELILRRYRRSKLKSGDLIEEARANGWYHDAEGMKQDDVGKLLESHGIPTRRYVGATALQLESELKSGHQVIVAVDSDADIGPLDGGAADPMVATGIGSKNGCDPKEVAVLAPGPGREAALYPMDEFLDAWQGGTFFMVATQEPPPLELNFPEVKPFDREASDLETIEDDERVEPATSNSHEEDVVSGDVVPGPDPNRNDRPTKLADPTHGYEMPPIFGTHHHGPYKPPERSDGPPQSNGEMPRLIDPGHHEPRATLFGGGLQGPHSLLAHDLDDPFGTDSEGDLLGDVDDLGDDGGFGLD